VLNKVPLSFTKKGWSMGQSARMSGALSTLWGPMRNNSTVWPLELSPPPSPGSVDEDDDCVMASIVSVVTISSCKNVKISKYWNSTENYTFFMKYFKYQSVWLKILNYNDLQIHTTVLLCFTPLVFWFCILLQYYGCYAKKVIGENNSLKNSFFCVLSFV
jgi:hypothetical protein